MPKFVHRLATIAAFTPIAALVAPLHDARAQAPDVAAGMHWREIGPTRAGRARALSGVPSQPNVFYAGFDNGGVWRSTDYGSTWMPLFDSQPTGSIGAIAVAPSDPNIIYVGTGAGIIRPDLATGDGVYRSADAGKTWTHLGLRDTRMIAMIDVDPKDPNRLFVAALGHPYGPNAERGIFRSTDGGKTFEKVLYHDEYTSGNDVHIDPKNPSVVYAALWEQQQAYIEGAGFGGANGGIYKSVDGGSTWKPIVDGIAPGIIEANLAIAPSNTRSIYAMVATGTGTSVARGGTVNFYKSSDGGEHWRVATRDPGMPASAQPVGVDARPLQRIGGGDLPTLAVDPKDENVVYSSSIVFWRTEDGGMTWSAVRGAPGGDDYQKTWINPNDPNIIFEVADQGAVVSANRGFSWSNWYTQPTAAMYHVSTDDAFPYRVCGGQQDSGSACVASRSDDGEITFHDWHPVNIQEYGVAAPDPADPDMVYASMRTNVSLYNRRTGQTALVGPDVAQRGTEFNRNVRTMPISWSPLQPGVLFYTSNAVWKSTDHAHTWTRVSPDLTRQTWTVPASVGKYSSTVKPVPQGSITALSLSPRDARVMWAGTDDGNIQNTSDGGASWHNVTPSAIKPWSRIFNIDAGHFDDGTAYAAANTMRIDDDNPHLWRTHDGGKTWTEIDNGIAGGAVTNAIREDPRKKGLLYASTDTQVWVSFDDGDHWQSLRLDMPAISVRDIEIKDDSICMCSDLIAGTHGRGFWILDDVTPLRQMAEAHASPAYLFRPQTAVRVRFATNDPTPWPPELPAGENPPDGAILDYFLGANSAGPVQVEILDASHRVIRTYSSADTARNPDPALDPVAYDRICHANPSAPDCGVPLYWPAPAQSLSSRAGMHRFTWDMRYEPVNDARSGDVDATGAVPHRSRPIESGPWAPAGSYTVRLTAGGKTYTQPLTLRMDPRVKTSSAALARLATLSRATYYDAVESHDAYAQARALAVVLDTLHGPDATALKAQLDSLAPAQSRARGIGGAAQQATTLESASSALLSAVMAMQSADVDPTAAQVAACARARKQGDAALARWNVLKTSGLAALNARRKSAGLAPVTLPRAGMRITLPIEGTEMEDDG